MHIAKQQYSTAYDSLHIEPCDRITDLENLGGYRGVCVTTDVPKDAALVSVPWEYALVVQDEQSELHWDTLLAMQLLEKMRDPNSIWRECAHLLPRRVASACLWSDQALEELQDRRTSQEAANIRDRFLRQVDLATSHASQRGALLWALSMVHSRSFVITRNEDPSGITAPGTRALVPFADQFNHAPAKRQRGSHGDGEGAPWRLVRAPGGARFEIVTRQPLERGEEATIDYGHDTNAELLVSYGFVLAPNPSDVVPLYADVQELLDDDRWVPHCSVRSQRLKEGLVHDSLQGTAGSGDQLGVRAGGSAHHALSALRILHATDQETEKLMSRYIDTTQMVSAANELSVFQHIVNRCYELLDELPTTMEEDRELLNLEYNIRDTQHNLALQYRLETKRTLNDAVVYHEKLMETLRG
eukprot:CAMPEP_0114241816 /NCGR_PEP_ID=MMETSP0058-20121206/9833_1 /TAXON_ID=36894 /ORGANISM="Pyramimonas parkeae, CCMP726" /LENGTH=414 /DNA_ID=CAMNT_0001354365 /DNA_START=270 /DNA_END=1514 /DNA_ORIENTATION=-